MRRWGALAATAGTMLVIGLDTTILNVALPDIALDLQASGAQLQWFADSYLLTLGALLLPAGMLGDRYGRKRFTVGGLVVFGLGSMWCTLATTAQSLIAARTLLGVGAAVLIPLAMSSVVVLFEPEERTRAIAVLGGSTMLGLPLGPILAGVLLQHYWWGSVFLVNLPVVVLALGAVLTLLPESTGERGRRLDLTGILLSSSGLLTATFGVIEGPERGWYDALVLTGLVGGLALIGGFLWWQRRDRGLEPVVDRALWAEPPFRWGSLTAAIASLAFFGAMFVVPQYLRGVLGVDALGTGLRSIPMVAGLLVGLRSTMGLMPRFGSRTLGVAGFAIGAAGFLLGSSVAIDSGYLLPITAESRRARRRRLSDRPRCRASDRPRCRASDRPSRHNRPMPPASQHPDRSVPIAPARPPAGRVATGLRERKKAKTRASIRAHALRLFKEQGYAETTVEQIAAAAEVSPSTFFRYFATKDEAVLDDLVDADTFQVMIDAPSQLTPMEALQHAIDATFRAMSDAELEMELTRNALIQSVPELRKGVMAEITRPVELLTEAVAVRLGRPVDDPDLRLYAGAVVGALMTVSMSGFENHPRETLASLSELVARLDRMVHLPGR